MALLPTAFRFQAGPVSKATSSSKAKAARIGSLRSSAARPDLKQIYEWLDDNDALVIKADNKPELIVLDLGDFFDLLAGK